MDERCDETFRRSKHARARGPERSARKGGTGLAAATGSGPVMLQLCVDAAYAQQQGLIVNAGHGLNYHNVEAIAAIPGMNELNIGHAIIARAVFSGLKEAVADMRTLLEQATVR